MKNKFIKSAYLILSIVFAITFTSCDEGGEPDAGATSTVEMSGDWYVQAFVDGEMAADYFKMTSYNTAANDGTEIWLDDNKNFYYFKFKNPINLTGLSFSGSDLASSVVDDDPDTEDVIETYDINVTVTNGIIVKKGATAPSGTTVDKISYDIVFSDDPDGTIYHIEGYKRTGFLEDEH